MKLNKTNLKLILALLLIALVLPSSLAEKLLSNHSTRLSKPRRDIKKGDWLESGRIGNPNGASTRFRPSPVPRITGGFNFENTIKYITTNSRILKRDDILRIRGWMSNQNFAATLCFSSDRQAKTPAAFHANCDGKGETLTVVKASSNYVFGGFTKTAWGGGRKLHKSDGSDFIFSLTRNRKLPNQDRSQGIDSDPNKFPSFGHMDSVGQDIWLPAGIFTQAYNISWLDSYRNGVSEKDRRSFLTGQPATRLTNLETYVITYPKADAPVKRISPPSRPSPVPRITGGFNFENTIRYITTNSRILKRNDVLKIRSWMSNQNFSATLCYSSDRQAKTPSAFHANCDGKGETLTVVKASSNYVFGGFTKTAWGGGRKLHKSDGSDFIFSLTRNRKLPNQDRSQGIESDPNKFPSFGHMDSVGQDIWLPAGIFTQAYNISWLDSYRNGVSEKDRRSFLTGQPATRLTNLEVYVIKYNGADAPVKRISPPSRPSPVPRITGGFNFDNTIRYITTNSRVLKRNDILKIRSWMSNQNFSATLCYSSDRHGKTPSAFHANCDGKGATLTIAKVSSNYVFGGFTNTAWGGGRKLHKSDGSDFIFSLTKNRKLPNQDRSQGIESDPNKFPSFGHMDSIGQDIWLPAGIFNQSYNISWLDSYRNGVSEKERRSFLTGQPATRLTNLEVYVIKYNGASSPVKRISPPSRPSPIPRKVGGFNFDNTIRYITTNSRVLKRNDIVKIRSWMSNKNFAATLCYSSDRHGKTPSAFHSKCDGKGATLTIAKVSSNYVFGG